MGFSNTWCIGNTCSLKLYGGNVYCKKKTETVQIFKLMLNDDNVESDMFVNGLCNLEVFCTWWKLISNNFFTKKYFQIGTK